MARPKKIKQYDIVSLGDDTYECVFRGDEMLIMVHCNDGRWDYKYDFMIEELGGTVNYIEKEALNGKQLEQIREVDPDMPAYDGDWDDS